ncbi:MAG: hypothetical protein Q9174_002690, partial [Haloplaca sp. 1 TL-2023]
MRAVANKADLRFYMLDSRESLAQRDLAEAYSGLSGPPSQLGKTESERLTSSTPGVRPSPLDGRPTTSTGTSSLDDLLGHSGLAVGASVLIEEDGTTEFGTTLLRYFAAEGIVQGQKVHVVGVPESWGKELPAVAGPIGYDATKAESSKEVNKERMKIAWRYERLGEFGAGMPAVDRGPKTNPPLEKTGLAPPAFCHSFDLTKRLSIQDPTAMNFIAIRPVPDHFSPFEYVIERLKDELSSSASTAVHRLIIPNLLSPVLFPPHASKPQHVLKFLHAIRALLRKYPAQLVAMITLPLLLYPQSTGLTRWMELLCDGVIELSPFPHWIDTALPSTASGAGGVVEEKPQGIVKVHRLPVFSEKGGGGTSADDLAFTVSRRKFIIKPFNLPPVEGDTEAQKGDGDGKPTKISKHVPRYLLFDIKTVSWLRRAHNILGVLIGSLPQSPQQNVFLGLPLELQPEEVKLLIEKDLAFVVDDLDSHIKAQNAPPKGLKEYRADVKREGLVAAIAVERQKRQRTKEALQRLNIRQSTPGGDDIIETLRDNEGANNEDSLFDRPQSRASQASSSDVAPFTSTPTTSYPPIAPPSRETTALIPDVNTASFALFKHLHKQGYFLLPGLRFGCQFTVYPGDPLRFHSHFLAVSAAWDEEIDLLDIVGGGRLGTGVKKAWMIGGPEEKTY